MYRPKIYKSLKIIPIAHFSVNKMSSRKGRFDYAKWKKINDEIFSALPDNFFPPDLDKYDIGFEVGTKLFDLDNVFKAYIDALERRYNFNDRLVMRILGRKVVVEEESEAYLKVFLLERVNFHDDESLIDTENKLELEVINEAWEEMRSLAKN